MKELILARHGQSEYMVTGLTGGWTDSPLTDLGRKQAYLTGQNLLFLKDSLQFYCSDLSRTAQTAHIIGEILSKEPVLVSDLRDFNNGIAKNCPREEAAKMRLPVTDPIMDWIPYPGAENWRMLHERVTTFLDRIENHDTTLLVAHAMVVISSIHWWLESTEEVINKISFDIDVCSITRLRINEWGEKTISKLNDTSHLMELEN
ncbi:MAG: histidine phosphatase family protein [Theionarchaea archaeon]|nr:histidine phosphatase family protein [Theionarchaea archaeon]